MSDERSFHRPITIIVEQIGRLPYERTLPHYVQMTVNHQFSRDKAREMIAFLEGELEKEYMEQITVTITGPAP